MAGYEDVLNIPRSTIKEPQPLPPGTYLASIKEYGAIEKRGKEGNEAIDFTLVLTAPQGDVDPQALSDFGSLPYEYKQTFWITKKSLFIIERFLQAVGITQQDAATVSEAIPLTVGKTVMAHFKMGKPNAKTGKTYAEVDGWAAA